MNPPFCIVLLNPMFLYRFVKSDAYFFISVFDRAAYGKEVIFPAGAIVGNQPFRVITAYGKESKNFFDCVSTANGSVAVKIDVGLLVFAALKPAKSRGLAPTVKLNT